MNVPYAVTGCMLQRGIKKGYNLNIFIYLFVLHPSAESVRLSSDSLSLEFRSLALLYVHADHFSNDCAYSTPPIPYDTTEFLHRRADTKHNVTCEEELG